ncbi:MmgE/PrpD family protein [Kribbella shirazensis]|uniref:2-methylcitrate dehydratase PrpD n=1 Tax=Kribbella shirazensis TaxID=1105143 RepID=A0A7X5VHQ0_9ACTN|nr:MmgE/PrpD family protein [Kribbella shirazensis]NIK61407.1 2-methylcitrate dehydratase PrpD [Kribbella shirazensis]
MSTIAERLARHVVELQYEDIPGMVVEKAKSHLAHHLGAVLIGRQRQNGQNTLRVAELIGGPDGACSVITTARRASVLDSVLLNALLPPNGFEDFVLPQGIHPGVVTHPVGWAFAEHEHRSGRDLLTAVIAGYDVLGRLCDPALSWGRVEPSHFVLEAFGAAATASKLLELSVEETLYAFGHTGLQTGRRVGEIGPHAVLMHPWIARHGATAAVLAKAGVTAPTDVLQGEQGVLNIVFASADTSWIEAELETLGEHFTITDTHPKLPGSPNAVNSAPLGITRRLMQEHALDYARIEQVAVFIPQERQLVEEQRSAMLTAPSSWSSRDVSLHYLVASVIADDWVGAGGLDGQSRTVLRAALDKVHLRYEAGRPIQYARVEITTADAEIYSGENADLESSAPQLDWEEWLTDSGLNVLSDRSLNRLLKLMRHLEDVSTVTDVLACLVCPPSPPRE